MIVAADVAVFLSVPFAEDEVVNDYDRVHCYELKDERSESVVKSSSQVARILNRENPVYQRL